MHAGDLSLKLKFLTDFHGNTCIIKWKENKAFEVPDLPVSKKARSLGEVTESRYGGDGLFHLKKDPLERCVALGRFHRRR